MELTTVSYESRGTHKVVVLNGIWKKKSIINWTKRLHGNMLAFSYRHSSGRRESFSFVNGEATLIGIYHR